MKKTAELKLLDETFEWGRKVAKEKGITKEFLRECLAEVRKQRQCSPALRSLIGCFKTKNPVDIIEILDVFK